MKIDDILTYWFYMWMLHWHISNYKCILFSNHLGNNITSMFYRFILYRCHFPRGEIFILTTVRGQYIRVSENGEVPSRHHACFRKRDMVIHDDWMIWENPMTLGTSLVGALEHCLFFNSVGNHNPKWRTHIFQRGRYTTNQMMYSGFLMLIIIINHPWLGMVNMRPTYL